MALTLRRIPSTARYYTEVLGNLEKSIPLQLLLLPAGTFAMGSSENEPGCEEGERPLHEVAIIHYFLSRYPITQAQWRVVANMPRVNRSLRADPSLFKGDNRPVEQVSWHDAVEFCARLASYTGRPYRLPSEAEWEYACRAGTTTPFHFGKVLTTEVANFDGKSHVDNLEHIYRGETTSVDAFGIANAFGLCDMHGNVNEWCQDNWHENYEGAPTDGTAWLTSDATSQRVVRGGSWNSVPDRCRSAYRLSFPSKYCKSIVGFRICCAAPVTLT